MKSVDWIENDLIRVRVGTNGNCGGIGIIVVKINPNQTNEIEFKASDFECDNFEGYGRNVAGAKLPPEVREAVFSGAKQAFQEKVLKYGIDFELINATLSISDLVGNKFHTAGFEAVKFWLDEKKRQ